MTYFKIKKLTPLSEGLFFKFFDTKTEKDKKRHQINKNTFSKTFIYSRRNKT
jgi:hypothetical protein